MQKPKSRLGRGMDSLLSINEETNNEEPDGTDPDFIPVPPPVIPSDNEAEVKLRLPASSHEMFHVELSKVTINPHQPRRTFDPVALEALAESLRSSGLIQPIVIRPVGDQYQLIAGERRLRAARIVGLKTLPAIVRAVDATEQAQMALIENIHREDLNPIDRALAYRRLVDELGLKQEELARRLGEERSTIANFIRLLELSDIARQAVIDGKISLGHAKILAGIADRLEQDRLTKLVISQELSVRNLERVLSDTPKPPTAKPGRTSAHIADLEKRLSRSLEMRVELRQSPKGGRGRLIIHYASLDQFDGLLARLQFESE